VKKWFPLLVAAGMLAGPVHGLDYVLPVTLISPVLGYGPPYKRLFGFPTIEAVCFDAVWGYPATGKLLTIPPGNVIECTRIVDGATNRNVWATPLCPDGYHPSINVETGYYQCARPGCPGGGYVFNPRTGYCERPGCSSGYATGIDGQCVSPAAGKQTAPTCPGQPGLAVGNPINAGEGVKYETLTLYGAHAGATLGYVLTYGSRVAHSGFHPDWRRGLYWVGNHDRRLALNYARSADLPPRSASVNRPDGRVFLFLPVPGVPDRYASTPDIDLSLERIVDAKGATTGWRLHAPGTGEVEVYGPYGTLKSIIDRLGVSTDFTHDHNDRLVSVSDSAGRSLGYAYDTASRVSELILPDGSRQRFAYDASSNLETIVYADGTVRRLHYEDSRFPHNLTGITDENGARYATWAYDSEGRAIRSEHAGGVDRHELSYAAGSTVVTDPLGAQRIKRHTTIHDAARYTGETQPSGAGCGASSRTVSYDVNGNVSSRTDFAGVETRYTHDLTRNLEVQRIEAFGRAESRTTSSAWHPDWPLVTRRAEAQRITTNIYNGQPDPEAGNAPLNCAPAEARILDKPIAVLCKRIEQATGDLDGSQGFAAATLGEARTWRHQYDRHGRLIHSDGPRTDVADITTYDYWPADASCPGAELGSGRDKGCRGQLRQITDALGNITRHTRYNAHGQLEERIAPNGRIDRFAYDARQRLVQRQHGEEITTYTYDPAGQLTRLVSPDGSHIDYRYDAAHRLIGLGDDAGNRIDYTLDAAGNRIGEDTRDPDGRLARTVTRAYDALGRLQGIAGAARE